MDKDRPHCPQLLDNSMAHNYAAQAPRQWTGWSSVLGHTPSTPIHTVAQWISSCSGMVLCCMFNSVVLDEPHDPVLATNFGLTEHYLLISGYSLEPAEQIVAGIVDLNCGFVVDYEPGSEGEQPCRQHQSRCGHGQQRDLLVSSSC